MCRRVVGPARPSYACRKRESSLRNFGKFCSLVRESRGHTTVEVSALSAERKPLRALKGIYPFCDHMSGVVVIFLFFCVSPPGGMMPKFRHKVGFRGSTSVPFGLLGVREV